MILCSTNEDRQYSRVFIHLKSSFMSFIYFPLITSIIAVLIGWSKQQRNTLHLSEPGFRDLGMAWIIVQRGLCGRLCAAGPRVKNNKSQSITNSFNPSIPESRFRQNSREYDFFLLSTVNHNNGGRLRGHPPSLLRPASILSAAFCLLSFWLSISIWAF